MKKISLVFMGLAFATYGFSQGIEKSEVKVQSVQSVQLEPSKAEKVKSTENPTPTKKEFNNYRLDQKSNLKLQEGSQKSAPPISQDKKAVELESKPKATETK